MERNYLFPDKLSILTQKIKISRKQEFKTKNIDFSNQGLKDNEVRELLGKIEK